MSDRNGRLGRWVRVWAHGWEMYVEATRGPITDRLVGPNPWGQTNERRRERDVYRRRA
jgi:hypothetical protein